MGGQQAVSAYGVGPSSGNAMGGMGGMGGQQAVSAYGVAPSSGPGGGAGGAGGSGGK
jgi:hypothetical protein